MNDYIKKAMSLQATINIGTIGHVAHGKSTLVRAISGIHTIKFKSELERNITIKLGYANAKIYECNCTLCPRPGKYKAFPSSSPDSMPCYRRGCKGTLNLIRHVSFVDCPGHDVLMATMLNGTAIMDLAILLVAGNESCPQEQTQEHLFAVEIMNLSRIIVVQNKIDLISREQALEQYEQIKDFIDSTKIKQGPIIPASGQLNINIDAVLDCIVNFPHPHRDLEADPRMVIIRSFDVNRPGCLIENLKGGVIGGSLVTGKIKVGDNIEIRPGLISRIGSKIICRPFITKITSLKADNNELIEAIPGGLIGVMTEMDPTYCRADKLVGQVMGIKGKLPEIYVEIEVEYKLFQKILSTQKEIAPLNTEEQVLLNIGSTTTGGYILEIDENTCKFSLMRPCCCAKEERIAISRKIQNHWRLIGWGKILGGKWIEPVYDGSSEGNSDPVIDSKL
ncbi:subunit gamma of translation initiation factor 2 [Hamiltosporidium tvaerminnensis]|uniref:Eukaryotic translation initiation factor 2 subunit gamma n=4 Tax=Hamiltosporidium TaxID=1176354 RepID=A0A4Q9LUU6_9MICR|nr:subunit gamma of translation initiation factor 2 [Hamiltosporidium tvaerminnensis]TBU14360.1 subunit gamma of translation initiation factor 2 [Hamiltosporidium tvaerminnensis]